MKCTASLQNSVLSVGGVRSCKEGGKQEGRGDILKWREGKGRRVTRLLIEEGQLMLMTAADNHCVKQRALKGQLV